MVGQRSKVGPQGRLGFLYSPLPPHFVQGLRSIALLIGLRDQILEHLDETLHRTFARGLVVGVPRELGFPHACLRQILLLLAARFDGPTTDVRAAGGR